MIVYNEENRYLKPMLESCLQYIDEAVIVDDASTDGTVALCEKMLESIPHQILVNTENMFGHEGELRQKLWRAAVATNPEWLMLLDADEIFEDGAAGRIRALAENPGYDLYCFPLYDMWDETHYRSDPLWTGHLRCFPRMLRYKPDFNYILPTSAQHCGSIPMNAYQLPTAVSNIRLRHFGWSNSLDRVKKYARYMRLDPFGKYGNMQQYQSILDKNPNLVLFE
jgi:glycosyltransferase involved in cell wall biosynthesis